MPRASRSQGRPGTTVVPPNWETDHATVVAKTLTAVVEIRPRASMPATINDDLSYTPAASPAPAYSGRARIQVLNGEESVKVLGEQVRATVAYLVVIDRSAGPIERGHMVKVLAASDPTLLEPGRRLVVERLDRGSLRWERDLYCIDELQEP